MPFNSETAREAGKKSKRTRDKQLSEIRGFITDFTEDNKEKLIEAFNSLHKTSPAKYIEYYLKLLPFIMPRADDSFNSREAKGEIDVSLLPPYMRPKQLPDWLTTKPRDEDQANPI